LKMIIAMAENDVIGDRGQLPWRLPADLRYFRERTLGRAVIMGRITWESLSNPLPKRCNIVISGKRGFRAKGAHVVRDMSAALKVAEDSPYSHEPPMIIGGAAIYRLFEPRVQTIYLTRVHAKPKGDTYYTLDEDRWEVTGQPLYRQRDERNPYDLTFLTLQRRAKSASAP